MTTDLTDAERSAAGLQQRRPWAQITPESLGTVGFGPMVTVYDLISGDRDERVAAAFTKEEATP